MKIYISLDMEGVVGVFNWSQEDKDRNEVRKYIMKQMEWVIEGVRKSNKNNLIDEITIADSHSRGDNLLYEITELDDRIHLISGYPRPQYMMPALNEDYDLVFFIGYHSGIGTLNGLMDHTYSSSRIHKIWINDTYMNEAIINAAYAGYYNIPVGLMIGDSALEKEMNENNIMPWVKYLSTKEGISRYSAKLRPMNVVKNESINIVKDLLDSDLNKLEVFKFEGTTTLKIEFQTTAMADVASLMPGTKRLDGRTIEFKHDDYKVLFDGLMALVTLSSTVV